MLLGAKRRSYGWRVHTDWAYRLARPLLFQLSPERAHEATLSTARAVSASRAATNAVARYCGAPRSSRLAQSIAGLSFPAPLGLAAGLDKDGAAPDFWPALGFGFVEFGTVTPDPGQPGNDKPRLWRLPADRALVNRMGFNNAGVSSLVARLRARRTRVPVGVNVGRAKRTAEAKSAEDYCRCIDLAWEVADYFVLNVSSPNTPGLRKLQDASALDGLLSAVDALMAHKVGKGARPPLFLKVAPDLAPAALQEIVAAAEAHHVTGFIATNTTIERPGGVGEGLAGGLSGAPLAPGARAVLKQLRRAAKAGTPLIAVGGVMNAEDAYERIRAGASLVQIYTALVYAGPRLVGQMLRGILELLDRDGFECIGDVVGIDAE